ncbi:MAG: hypothetical protein RSF86_14500 [Angelakisella sp.]
MGRTFRYLLTFISGSCTGLLAAQALIATIARNGSSPGGEILILPAITLIIWCGYTFGRDTQQYHAYRSGYKHGYTEGARKEESHDK